MNTIKKFSFSFVLALSLHLSILILFGISFIEEAEETQVKQPPEIIQASILDEEKIQQEAQRLKDKEENKYLLQQKKQKEAENSLKKEQQRLRDAKEKRLLEEQKAKELEKKTQALAQKEKQHQEKLKQLVIVEAARKAKIKAQQEAEAKKRKQEKIAKEIKQQELLAKQKAKAEQKQALLAKQAAARKAKAEQDKQAVITAEHAIQQKVINRWIKPVTSVKGMSCMVRVKLLPSGDVMDVSVIKGSGDGIFDRSAENAVRKASPLPVPRNRALFSRRFRSFTFKFKPEE